MRKPKQTLLPGLIAIPSRIVESEMPAWRREPDGAGAPRPPGIGVAEAGAD